ncbi:hypothetical protein L211DRAFT_267896 [Terfezia boudieri ATCC MYA-4762]|uniref:Uncharacterized protein n=1 Tax=Terfezia boudieri ATCC MYA-4762 TaxID=1051890 RepID=A0A3N4LPI0_9PEZI|nr:hypothetical protein L211DRAFT_267896 [Terfezia boudieri ATCC MYA-4762]
MDNARRGLHLAYVNNGATIWLSNVTAFEFSTVDIVSVSARELSTRSNTEFRPYITRNESASAQEWRWTEVSDIGQISRNCAFGCIPDAMGVMKTVAVGAKEYGWKKLMREHDAAWGELWGST